MVGFRYYRSQVVRTLIKGKRLPGRAVSFLKFCLAGCYQQPFWPGVQVAVPSQVG